MGELFGSHLDADVSHFVDTATEARGMQCQRALAVCNDISSCRYDGAEHALDTVHGIAAKIHR